MFYRNLSEELQRWKEKGDRKPLILRGARQVGKTTLVNMFAGSFSHYIYLNLEKAEERRIFENGRSFRDILDAIFFLKAKPRYSEGTLIFIDEIQYSPDAVASLRYFFEEAPDLYVIAAGSLLESLIDHHISFPVGRVEYIAVRPCTFFEFLSATGEHNSLETCRQFPVPGFAHDHLLSLFHRYTVIGGMPGVIQKYAGRKDITDLSTIYDQLLTSYLDDVEKYARNLPMAQVIRHVIKSAFQYFGTRIRFERFGNSNYRSREVGEAFRTLEKAMLLRLVYPAESSQLPLFQNFRKAPKLQLFDTGLVNYISKLQPDLFMAGDMTDTFRGRVAEHIVGQELLAAESSVLSTLYFWTREQKNAQAEVDFIVPFEGKLIPVEVKSGVVGKMKSLQLFMEQAGHQTAIRFWSGAYGTEHIRTVSGKEFTIYSLPLYLAGNLNIILKKIFDLS